MEDEISRRSFLKIAALAGSAVAAEACRPQHGTKLIPYLVPEQNVIPGVPAFYRTACFECSAGCGVVARVREGRAIKLEGNPDNPINAGALCARGQAALQELYNPDRLPAPRQRNPRGALNEIAWDDAIRRLALDCKHAASRGANRVAFIGRPRGPSFHDILSTVFGQFKSTSIVYYEPLTEAAAIEATQKCFGRSDLPAYRIDQAEVLISFGADFLETWRSPVEFSRQYAAFRTPTHDPSRKHLIGVGYYVGPRMSLTAAKSDYYLKCRPGTEATVALGILRSMNDQGLLKHVDNQEVLKRFVAPFAPEQVERQSGVSARQLGLMAKDFGSARSALALAAGDDPALHTAIYIINALSGNLNNTLFFSKTPSPSLIPQSQRTTAALLEAIRSHEVDVLIVADANPAFSMSSALEFASIVRHVPSVVWCGSVPDETAELAHLLLPIHHTLEDWSDAEVRTSIRTLGQPVMQPVFNSHSLGDILLDTARMAGGTPRWPDIRAAVEDHWSSLASHEANHPSFAQFWDDARRNGGFFTKIQPTPVQLSRTVFQQPMQIPSSDEKATTLVAYPHVFFYDGRGADKPWLQENPEPVSQLVWDSWVEIHPDTAKALEIHDDDLVEIKSSHGAIELPAKLDHGVQAQTIAVPLGQGHSSFGRYATGRGANPWPILPPDSLRVSVKLRRTGKHHKLVSPLFTANMMHRPIVEKISLDDVKNGHRPADEEPPPPKPYELWPEHVYKKHHWGMTIDVNSCTGCGACVTACYAENNLNVVGREGVRMGRIMSWLRVERYFPEDLDSPQIYLMPMLCQQCDHAPCEPVCPVYASSHTEEGLNAQVYNRCVGTRYCENNCPYKVRRFNWFRPEFAEPLHLQLNPDVTVRGEGVMEKCTFCIQRIRAAEITATVEDRALHDGEIIPACAQTCPSEAIIFGDILDPHSKMMLRRKEHHIRNYRALEELNTKPSIVYLRTIYRPREV